MNSHLHKGIHIEMCISIYIQVFWLEKRGNTFHTILKVFGMLQN